MFSIPCEEQFYKRSLIPYLNLQNYVENNMINFVFEYKGILYLIHKQFLSTYNYKSLEYIKSINL
jgi:hypothetical protein